MASVRQSVRMRALRTVRVPNPIPVSVTPATSRSIRLASQCVQKDVAPTVSALSPKSVTAIRVTYGMSTLIGVCPNVNRVVARTVSARCQTTVNARNSSYPKTSIAPTVRWPGGFI